MISRLNSCFSVDKKYRYPFFVKGREDVIGIHITKTTDTSLIDTLNFNSPIKKLNIKKLHLNHNLPAIDYSAFCIEELKTIVENHYMDDFETFDYAFESENI